MNARKQIKDLHALVDRLEQDEVLVALALLKRLELGRQRYGPLDLFQDRRDWAKEAREELLDFLIYCVIRWLKLGREEIES